MSMERLGVVAVFALLISGCGGSSNSKAARYCNRVESKSPFIEQVEAKLGPPDADAKSGNARVIAYGDVNFNFIQSGGDDIWLLTDCG